MFNFLLIAKVCEYNWQDKNRIAFSSDCSKRSSTYVCHCNITLLCMQLNLRPNVKEIHMDCPFKEKSHGVHLCIMGCWCHACGKRNKSPSLMQFSVMPIFVTPFHWSSVLSSPDWQPICFPWLWYHFTPALPQNTWLALCFKQSYSCISKDLADVTPLTTWW